MFERFDILIISITYLLALFIIAYLGDKYASTYTRRWRPAILSLCLGIYFTAWTFYGTTGQAIHKGWYIPPTFVGSILLFALAVPFIKKLIAAGKKHNSTSIADFISSHYGKSQSLAILVTLVCIVALLPYFSLQLKAVSLSYSILTEPGGSVLANSILIPFWRDAAFYIALLMAVFAIMFGTRHIDIKEHHDGLMLAIAFESLVKLFSFCAVGYYAGYQLHGGLKDLLVEASSNPNVQQLISAQDTNGYTAAVILGMAMIVCLPRLFHVLVVESDGPDDVDTAQWVFPLYALVLAFFTLVIVFAGVLYFEQDTSAAEFAFLSLPVAAEKPGLSLLAYLGGLSAATSMVIVATVTLATMICNDIVMPILFRYRLCRVHQRENVVSLLLTIRRTTIVVILLLAYFYYRLLGSYDYLGAIGLLSLSLIAQLAPAIVGALYWRRGHKLGVYTGIAVGSVLWVYTLLLPTVIRAGWLSETILQKGPMGIDWLLPEALFGIEGLDRLSHGVYWSLLANSMVFICVSLYRNARRPTSGKVEQTGELTIAAVQKLVARFIGADQARLALMEYTQNKKIESIDIPAESGLIHYVENLLAGFIGAASARRVFELAGKENTASGTDPESFILETSEITRFSRELLQASIDNISQGISVADHNLQLVAWNKRYLELFEYQEGMIHVGTKVEDLIRFNAQRGECGSGPIDEHVRKRLAYMRRGSAYTFERIRADQTVLEIQGNPMPGGGFVTTYTDITDYTRVVGELKHTNENLEQRVEQRTKEYSDLNRQLMQAKSVAEKANQSKTRFLAAAGHDLIQPLNASRLFLTALQQRDMPAEHLALVEHLANSQQTAEALIRELLDIAKIDAGAVTPDVDNFPISVILDSLATDYCALAEEEGLHFVKKNCNVIVQSDPALLRRILQNFLANALRYTRSGRVLLGCRRESNFLRIEIWDTGPGIPEQFIGEIFTEFKRLDTSKRDGGLGLGLATVQRLCQLMGHPLEVKSQLGKGSVFSVTVPMGVAPNKAVTTGAGLRKGGLSKNLIAGLKVLCIDNDRAILTGMEAVIGRWGCEVICCRSEAEVQVAVDSGGTPDVILVDYHLDDGLTGIALSRDLLARWQVTLPCIVISADRSEEVKAEAHGHGFMFIQKPLKAAALRAGLDRIARTSRSGSLVL